MFKKKLSSLKRVLSALKEDGIIDDQTHQDYMLLISRVQTSDQLDEIAQDLFEIRQSVPHSVSFR